jgi:hypothetical protein
MYFPRTSGPVNLALNFNLFKARVPRAKVCLVFRFDILPLEGLT